MVAVEMTLTFKAPDGYTFREAANAAVAVVNFIQATVLPGEILATLDVVNVVLRKGDEE